MGALRQPYLLSLVWSVRNEAPPTRPTKGTRRPSPAHARVESMARRAARRSACRFAWSDGRRADDATRPTRIELRRRAARLRPTHGLEHSQLRRASHGAAPDQPDYHSPARTPRLSAVRRSAAGSAR